MFLSLFQSIVRVLVCTSAMCVGLCTCVSVCVRVPVSQSLSLVCMADQSVSVYHRRLVSGADVWWCCVSNWWPHSRPAPFTQVHGSLGPVTESTRAIAGLTLSLSVPASYKHVHITTMSMTRIKAKRLSNATDWDRLWPYWESRQHWCGQTDEKQNEE